MSDMPKKIEGLIIELNKSYKALQFYPEGHPALTAANKRTIGFINDIIGDDPEVSFSIKRVGFEFEGEPLLKGAEEFAQFAKEFFARSISKIIFQREITVKELIHFSQFLSRDPKEIREAGGTENVMLALGIEHIWANEVNYEKLIEHKTYIEEQEEEEEIVEAEEEDIYGEEEEGEEAEEEETFESALEDAATEEEKEALSELEEVFLTDIELFSLLKKLAAETDSDKYDTMLNKIVNTCHHINRREEYDIVIKVIFYLLSLAKNPVQSFPDQRELIVAKIKESSVSELITRLVYQMNTDENKNRYFSMFLLLGDVCVPVLLDYLGKKADTNSRHNVSDALSYYGEESFDAIAPWLEDERWPVVCGAVAAIGKIGEESGLPLLSPLHDHPDTRVQREQLKAYGRIRSMESFAYILTVIKLRNTDIIKNALLSFGDLKMPETIPYLIKFTKKGILDTNEIETRKVAVAALGNTGLHEAISPLLRILRHPSFFFRAESEVLRPVAIRALGAIGGEEAIQALELGVNLKNTALSDECKSVLEKVAENMKNEENIDA